MTATNRFYANTFTASLGSLILSSAHDVQYDRIQYAFDQLMVEVDALQGVSGITALDGFPSSFASQGLKYLRVNAAESAVEFVAGGKVDIKSVSGTSYTVLATDAGKVVHFTNAAAVTVTVPKNTLTQGDVVCFRQSGAGQVTLVAASGVTLNSTDSLLSTRKQHAQIAIVCDDATTDANVFGVLGERNAPTLTLYWEQQLSCSDLTTSITTGTSKAYFRMPRAIQNLTVRASLLTASTSGAVTVDINKNGSTILSTKLTIDQDEKTSVTAATAAVLTSATAAADDEITIDIDGAGTGAKGLIVTLLAELA